MEKINFWLVKLNNPQALKVISLTMTVLAVFFMVDSPSAGSGIGGH
jgi:hypothetical protein